MLSSVVIGRDLQVSRIEKPPGSADDRKRQLLLVALEICPLVAILRPPYFPCPATRVACWRSVSPKARIPRWLGLRFVPGARGVQLRLSAHRSVGQREIETSCTSRTVFPRFGSERRSKRVAG